MNFLFALLVPGLLDALASFGTTALSFISAIVALFTGGGATG